MCRSPGLVLRLKRRTPQLGVWERTTALSSEKGVRFPTVLLLKSDTHARAHAHPWLTSDESSSIVWNEIGKAVQKGRATTTMVDRNWMANLRFTPKSLTRLALPELCAFRADPRPSLAWTPF